jgi:hypothetical protein
MSVAPRKRQLATKMRHVVKGQKETHAPQQKASLFDHLVGALNCQTARRVQGAEPERQLWGQSRLGRGKLQIQQCPRCPVSDGRPKKGGLS